MARTTPARILDTTLDIADDMGWGRLRLRQVAARLNWPCVRVNLDGHISRLDLVGKDAIVVRDKPEPAFEVPAIVEEIATLFKAELVLEDGAGGRGLKASIRF